MTENWKLQNELKAELKSKLLEMPDLKIGPLSEIFQQKKYEEFEQIDFNDTLNDVLTDITGTIQYDIDRLILLVNIMNNIEYKPTNIDPARLNIKGIKEKIEKLDDIK